MDRNPKRPTLSIRTYYRDRVWFTQLLFASGMPEYLAIDWSMWTAIYAPANTPRPIVDQLYAAYNAALGKPKLRAALSVYAMDPMVDYAPERVVAFQDRQFRTWKAIVETLGIPRGRTPAELLRPERRFGRPGPPMG